MSKIRVYELAKELGLENKAVLDLCKTLGMDDKASHSNSLSDEEADRIRRSVIRRAVSEKSSGQIREVSKEGHLLTESRVGSVIRRRKKSDEEEEEELSAAPKLDLESVMQQNSARPLPSLAPDPVAERSTRANALRDAEALFKPRAQPSEVKEEEDDEESEQEAAAPAAEERPMAERAHLEHEAAQPAPAAEEAEEEELEEEAEEESEAPEAEEPQENGVATAPAEAETGAAPQTEAHGQAVPAEPAVEGDAEREQRLADSRRRLDIRAPKVLGRIELPTRPTPTKRPAPGAAKEDGASTNGTQAAASDSDGARGRHKTKQKAKTTSAEEDADQLAKKKVKKKQVLRKDELLDYEGERDSWRARKDKKSSKSRDHGSSGEDASNPTRQSKKQLKISGQISVGEMSKLMGVKASEVIPKLMGLGVMAGINQLVDFETATIIAGEFGFTTTNVGEDSEDMVATLRQPDDPEKAVLRPPVVTVMGHVDHGKTSLLDAIRKTTVTASEVGGITQHIGAYTVTVPSGGLVTFLDTPGHEAFTAMRSRGAKVTDIVVLVVAADDGVMPQTIEAINHAKAANVPIIVAVNKIDKENAMPERVVSQLNEHGLVPEEWGGDTIVVKVSAHTGEGLDLLLENLALQAEILELKADPTRPAMGTVVESQLDKGRGAVMTVLVQNGTLRKGEIFVAGAEYGRVRALISYDGSRVDEAGPSIPVAVLGASGTPLAGDDFVVCESEAQARRIADLRSQSRRAKNLAAGEGAMQVGLPLTLERFSQMVGSTTADMKELPLIVKADVQGSVEAVSEQLLQLGNEEVKVRVIHKAVGAVTENDIQLASASGALLVGFNVRAEPRAAQLAISEGVEILYSRIIYELVDEISKAIEGKRAPRFQEKTLGRAEVRQTFKVPRLGTVAGTYVLDGQIQRGAQVRLLRDSKIVYEGKMASLRRFKDDVREVAAGYECGIGIEGYSDIKDGDIIEVFKVEEVRP